MSECERCRALNMFFKIKLPNDLKKVIRIAKENIADNTLSLSEEETGLWSGPFSKLSSDGCWEDFVYYVFKCNSCGKKFELSAETYHGSGGHWKPL